MTAHVNVSGVWKEITEMHVKVSGAWKEITEGWVNVSGTWKQFFQNVTVVLTAGTYRTDTITPTDAICQYRLTSGGLEQADEGSGFSTVGTWLLDGAAADYDVRYTYTGDTGDATGTNGTWESLSSTRLWSIADTGGVGPTKEITGTIEIRDASSLDVLVATSLTLQALESA